MLRNEKKEENEENTVDKIIHHPLETILEIRRTDKKTPDMAIRGERPISEKTLQQAEKES